MIIIERISLNNFRRYHKAEFQFNTSENKNFNLILARNGVGKSTLFDAFTWCLFDEEDHLTIDARYFDESEGILNTTVEKQLKPNEKTKVIITVFLLDTKKKKRYKIEKEVLYQKNTAGQVLNGEPVKNIFEKGERDRDWTRIREIPPEAIIEKLIPKNLRQFFFFDGERLREHFHKNANVYLKEKIEQVSRVNTLNDLIGELMVYHSELYEKKRKSITDEKLKHLQDEIDSIDENVGECQKVIDGLDAKIKINRDERRRLDEKIRGFGESIANIKSINEKYDQTEKSIQNIQEELSGFYKDYRKFILDNAPLVFLSEKLHLALSCVNAAVQKKLAPPPLTEDYLKQLLGDNTCMCGTSLKGDKNAHREQLEKLLKTLKGVKSINYSEGQFLWDHWLQKINAFKEEANSYNKKITERETNLKILAEKLDQLKSIRKTDSEKEIRLLQTQIDALDSDHEHYLHDRAEQKADQDTLLSQLSNDKREFKEKETLMGKNIILIAKEEKSDAILKELKKFRDYLVKRNIETLTQKTEENLKRLLTEKRDEIDHVEIDMDYELKIRSKINPSKNLRHTLSAGETHIFILSFAAALREVTGFSAPLVIDTPLGKIDDEYRLEVIRALPKIFSDTQLVFLVTSSEYTKKIESAFKDSMGHLKEYEVVKDQVNRAFNLVTAK